jgi:peptidoglycan/xylan/chitin deacetylase (PgdA/CDA1 family)
MLRTLIFACLVCPALALAQSISFTFDDGLDPRTQPSAALWNGKILQALDTQGVTAMIFPAGKNVDSPEGLNLVRRWGQAGHAVGNHTYSHENFGSARVGLDAFTADVLRADQLLNATRGWTRRLRFPYLKEGDTGAKRDGMRQWMAQQGYRPGPVSIDTSDWYYNERFLQWRSRHPKEDPGPIRQAYLAHLWDRAQYYDGLGKASLGRSPAHVMLLHTSFINAEFLTDILSMFRAKGWKVVSPKEAFEDPLYAMTPETVPAGESILWSIANKSGVTGLRYPAEDDVYEKPKLDALGI